MIEHYIITGGADEEKVLVIPSNQLQGSSPFLFSSPFLSICNTSDTLTTSVDIFYGRITVDEVGPNDWNDPVETLEINYLLKNYPLSVGGLLQVDGKDLVFDNTVYGLYIQTTTVGGVLEITYKTI